MTGLQLSGLASGMETAAIISQLMCLRRAHERRHRRTARARAHAEVEGHRDVGRVCASGRSRPGRGRAQGLRQRLARLARATGFAQRFKAALDPFTRPATGY
jgi:hypothetical protein